MVWPTTIVQLRLRPAPKVTAVASTSPPEPEPLLARNVPSAQPRAASTHAANATAGWVELYACLRWPRSSKTASVVEPIRAPACGPARSTM
jgi:hypothetical protein